MTTGAKIAHGTTFKRAGVAIAEVTKLGDFEIETDDVEVTNSGSNGWVEKIPGLKSGKDITIECNYIPTDAVQQALVTDQAAGTISSFTIDGPTGLPFSWGFTGYVKSCKTVTPQDAKDAAKFVVTIAVTGQPVLTYALSGDLTGLTISVGSLIPGLTAGIYDYGDSLTAGTASVTITATKASATILLYVNDVLVQTLTSGSASSAITTPVGTTRLLITTQDAGKVPKPYRVNLYRSS